MRWWRLAAIGVGLGLGLVLLRACQPAAGIQPYSQAADALDDPIVWLLLSIGVLIGVDQWRNG